MSEGVDVPALDGIVFMHPRKSQIDIIQSIGRVMRKAKGKEMGYIIVPVIERHGIDKHKARYEEIKGIINALRSHDDSMDAYINKLALGESEGGESGSPDDKIIIIGATHKSDVEHESMRRVSMSLQEKKHFADSVIATISECGTRGYCGELGQII